MMSSPAKSTTEPQESNESTPLLTPSKKIHTFLKKCFENPWKTWFNPWLRICAALRFFCMRNEGGKPSEQELKENLPLEIYHKQEPPNSGVNITWLGHASALVQFDGITVLTDPVFSEYCGPYNIPCFSFKRFRPAPCMVNDLPVIDAVVISHNHYDHLDLPTVNNLHQRFGNELRWFVPLGLRDWFPWEDKTNVVEMDWWQEDTIIPKKHIGSQSAPVKFVLTPCQHWSGRIPFIDNFKSLWGSWAIIGPKHKFFFAGDTGYCEVFKEIGKHFESFDVAAIPIGAYKPRSFLSPQHVDPAQAVQIHKDIRAKQSVGIHWGTFQLGREGYLAPQIELKEAVSKGGLSEQEFITMKHGETRLLPDDNPGPGTEV